MYVRKNGKIISIIVCLIATIISSFFINGNGRVKKVNYKQQNERIVEAYNSNVINSSESSVNINDNLSDLFADYISVDEKGYINLNFPIEIENNLSASIIEYFSSGVRNINLVLHNDYIIEKNKIYIEERLASPMYELGRHLYQIHYEDIKGWHVHVYVDGNTKNEKNHFCLKLPSLDPCDGTGKLQNENKQFLSNL